MDKESLLKRILEELDDDYDDKIEGLIRRISFLERRLREKSTGVAGKY